MNEVIEFLNENPVQYLATVDLDGKPRVRPFQFMLEEEGKLYFCTNNQKNVFINNLKSHLMLKLQLLVPHLHGYDSEVKLYFLMM